MFTFNYHYLFIYLLVYFSFDLCVIKMKKTPFIEFFTLCGKLDRYQVDYNWIIQIEMGVTELVFEL